MRFRIVCSGVLSLSMAKYATCLWWLVLIIRGALTEGQWETQGCQDSR